jgi:hypothetical protein
MFDEDFNVNALRTQLRRARDYRNPVVPRQEGDKSPKYVRDPRDVDTPLLDRAMPGYFMNYIMKMEDKVPDVNEALPTPDPKLYRADPHGTATKSTRDLTNEAPIRPYLGLDGIARKLDEAVESSRTPSAYRSEFKKLLYTYADVFRTEGDKSQACPLFEQSIPLTDDIPVCVKQYPLPRAAREALKDRVTEFLDAGIIQPSNSAYNSPVWMVQKKDGTWRVCVDYRELNKKIPNDPFPLPRIEEMLEEFRDCQFISTCDLYWGFYQIPVNRADTHKLAFSTDQGRFEFIHLPMGLRTSPAVFQRLMNLVFTDYLKHFVLVYMDDMIIYSSSADEHMQRLNQIFERMRSAGLKFKIEKCKFFQTELSFLGFIISKEGISLDPKKVKAVVDFPKPNTDLGQLQSFLGMVGYFKRHIKDYAVLAKPLYEMMRGEATHKKKHQGRVRTEFKKNEWGARQDAAFEALKYAATTAPVLIYPDFSKQFILTTDASAHALGFVLSQDFEDGEHPIAYGSRQLKGAELNYSNTDREMLAVVKGIEHFRPYLYGRHFLIRTDHQAIPMIHKGKPTSRRVLRWYLDVEDYTFDIVYTPATKIKHADALSRVKIEEEAAEANMLSNAYERNWVPVVNMADWGADQRKDPDMAEKYKSALANKDGNYALKDGVLYQLIEGCYVPLVPTAYRRRILKQFHGPPAQGHLGPEKTYLTMRSQLHWPGMKRDVFEYVEQCDLCQRHKRSYLRVPMQHQSIPSRPFHTVTMDVVGPVVKSNFGEQYILVMQDMLVRWVELAPMKIADTRSILDKFEKYWIFRYGLPERLLTDRAAVFTGEAMREWCQFYGVEKLHTIAYRPQSNGMNERMHQELAKYFSIYLEGQSKARWPAEMQKASWVYNTSFHTSIGMSPYEALFGEPPPMGAQGIPKTGDELENFERFYGMRRQQLVERQKLVQKSLMRAQERAIEHKNKNAHKIPFTKGDYVLYKNNNPKTKWDEKYYGPWKIIDQISPVIFELEMEGCRFSAHAAQLKLYKGFKPVSNDEPPPDESDEDEIIIYSPERAILQANEEPTEDEADLTIVATPGEAPRTPEGRKRTSLLKDVKVKLVNFRKAMTPAFSSRRSPDAQESRQEPSDGDGSYGRGHRKKRPTQRYDPSDYTK